MGICIKVLGAWKLKMSACGITHRPTLPVEYDGIVDRRAACRDPIG